jgi:glycosyltransferase involved in cell wall biosynthesis
MKDVRREPLVSIILPVWNGAQYLAEAVESLLDQTFEAFELLIVNDGSTDLTSSRAHHFARRDPRVKVIELAHSGIVAALNAGLAAARAPYIARMDCDDYSLPTRLENQVAYLNSHPGCVAVGGDIEIIDEAGELIGHLSFPRDHADILRTLLTHSGNAIPHPTVMMRAAAVKAVGGYSAPHFPAEDFGLWLRLAEVGELANLPQKLLRYRRHRNSVGVREHRQQLSTVLEILNAARLRRGLKALKTARKAPALSPAVVYHNQCAVFAARSGKKKLTIKHALASIARSPFCIRPYTALITCMLPSSLAQFVISCRVRLISWARTES